MGWQYLRSTKPSTEEIPMRKNYISSGLLAMLVVAAVLLVQCGKKKGKPSTYDTVTTSDSCTCEANWFPHSQTPPPQEGIGSPFDTSSTTNCIFHQWSWQKFLWLTKPSPSGALFLDTLVQVNALMQPVIPPSSNPSVRLILSDTAQAGSGGSLHSNPAFSSNTSYMVYYAIFANQELLDTAAALKNLFAANPSLRNNSYTFPVGSLELKTSWINIDAIPQNLQSSYFTTTALIQTGSTYTQTTVALLGMHVVGRVINHPEFIWATFEHHQMAPYYNWANTTTTQDAPITSANQTLLFAAGTTTGLYGIHWNETLSSPDSLYRVYTLFQYGVPRQALDTFMTGTSQSEPINFNNIDELNTCVAQGLGSEVWANYFYNGSIWLNMDGQSTQQQSDIIDSLSAGFYMANATTGSLARGSLNTFNITMETYTQNFLSPPTPIHTINAGNLSNCFSCHSGESSLATSNSYISPLYVSHIFQRYLSTSNEQEAKEQGILEYIKVQRMKLKSTEK